MLGCHSLVLMEMCLGFAWQLASCCLVLIEVCLGFIWLLQFGSDRGVLGFYLAVAVWF